MKMSDFSKDQLRQIADSLTPEEREFTRVVGQVFQKVAKDVEQTMDRLRIAPSRYLRSFWPVPRQYGDSPRSNSAQDVPWSGERLKGSIVVGFSKERDRIMEQVKSETFDSLLNANFVNIVDAIVGNTDDKGERIGPERDSSGLGLKAVERNDVYLFELGAMLLFVVDLWQVCNRYGDARARIFHGQIVPLFLRLFEDSLGTKNLGPVFINRFQFYYAIMESKRSHGENLRSSFVELAKRCSRDAVPVAYDFKKDFPILIVDIRDEITLSIDWGASVASMAKPICEGLEYAYRR